MGERRGLLAGWAGARFPGGLEELHGPRHGIVVLPVHLTWHGHREFDVSSQQPRLVLYSIVLSQGRRNDLARFVNAWRLREDWPQLCELLNGRTRKMWERKLGMRSLSTRYRSGVSTSQAPPLIAWLDFHHPWHTMDRG
jgi:hypothetical protein